MSEAPQPSPTITKEAFTAEVTAAPLSEDVKQALLVWIADQPGNDLPETAVAEILTEMAKVERATAEALADAHRVLEHGLRDEDQAEQDETVATLEAQRTGMQAAQLVVDQLDEEFPDDNKQ